MLEEVCLTVQKMELLIPAIVSGLRGEYFFHMYSFFFFLLLLKFRTLDLTMISALHSCILLLFFSQESLDYICSDTCLFSSSWKRDSGTNEPEGGRKMYGCKERGKRISFSLHEKKNKTEARQLGFLVTKPRQNNIIVAL